jgi:hypothetical protein
MIKADLASVWQIVLILNSILHVDLSVEILSKRNSSLEDLQIYLGIATLFSWVSLNDYLMYYKDYAFLPRTIFHSSLAVANGLVGVMPLFIGFAILTNTYLYKCFRF